MSATNRVRFAWVLFICSVIGWPVTALTVFRDEPQGILGLSWAAIALTAIDVIFTADVHKNQEDDSD